MLCIGAYAYDKQKKAKRAATSALLKEEQQGLTAGVGGSYGTCCSHDACARVRMKDVKESIDD